jgi:hypothetical protein
LALADPVPNPVKTQFHRFGTFLFQRVVCDAGCGEIVCDDGSWELGVTELVEAHAMGARCLAAMEQGPGFGFDSAGHNMVHDLAGDMIDGAIVGGWGVVRVWGFGRVSGHVAEVVISSETGSSLRFRQVRRITFNLKYHIAGAELDDGVRVCGGIVEELVHGCEGVCGEFGLIGGQGAQCHQHGAIKGTCIIQERANDFLQAFYVFSVHERGLIVLRVLNMGPISGGSPWVWRVLWPGRCRVGEPEKGSFHAPRHEQFDCAANVILFEGEAGVAGPLPIFGDLVLEF